MPIRTRRLPPRPRLVPAIFLATRYPRRATGWPAQVALPGGVTTAEVVTERRPVFVPPMTPLVEASRVVAHNFAVLDPDGPWRRYVPYVRYGGQTIPSLAFAAATVALGHVPADVPRTHGRLLIDYRSRRADGASPYRRVSFYKLFYAEQQLIDGQAAIEDPETFRNKIVIVGATAAALDDVFTVPGVRGKVGGLEVHAAVLDAILAGRVLAPAPLARALALTLAAAVTLGVIGAFVGPWITTVVALVLWGVITAVATWQFTGGTLVPARGPAAGAGADDVWRCRPTQYFVEGREKRRVKRLFSRYVSRDVYQQLLADPRGARLGGQRRQMTVLFSDMRGFTALSERASRKRSSRS